MRERENRSVARYFLAPPLAGAVDGKPVSLVDLSMKGARLELSSELHAGSQINLQVEAPTGRLKAEATVLWCQIDELRLDGSDDRYLSGVVFREQQPAMESLLEDLTGSGAAVLIEDFRCEDRYTITSPMTGSFGDVAPVSILDLSFHGGRLSVRSKIASGTSGPLRFQVDEKTGPIEVMAKVMWSAPSPDGVGFAAGLNIAGREDQLRTIIHRLCTRGEACIDALSLRRKFDAMRSRVPA
ncbi:MAG: PilZ domain-containing protein [Thermoanaerobaculia bacterium]